MTYVNHRDTEGAEDALRAFLGGQRHEPAPNKLCEASVFSVS